MLLLSCSGYSYCQIKASGPVSWQTYQSSSHAITVRNILPCCFMCNCRKIVIAEGSQKNQPCCCWQVCERSGTKPKAIKNSVRGHAKHDGKLQQWGQQSRRPVFQFIRHPPTPTSWLLLQDSPKHPSSAFHTPVWSKQAGEELQFQGIHSLSRRNSGTDKQPRDNPIEFSLSSLAPLPVC